MEQVSCPNCEYERGVRGKPEARGDRIYCLECGTNWKEISANASIAIEDKSRDKIISDLRSSLQKQETSQFDGTIGTATKAHPIPQGTGVSFSAIGGATLAVCLMAALLLVGVDGNSIFNKTQSTHAANQPVSLREVVFNERVGRAGKKVITVRGLLENGTNEFQAIRPISIILRRKDGGEIIRWRHVSHRPVLKAGGKSRFASSIQYDTPIIAYAEAVFE